MTLRDYQQNTIDRIIRSMKSGHQSIIVQQPPRTGKTVIMAEIAKRTTDNGNHIMFMVHRKEIVDQVKRTFSRWGVNMNLATIGMVQTITRRLDKLEPPAVLFIDEAHHALAKSYMRIIERYPDAYKFLFTATPWRMNGDGFEAVADDLIQGQSVQWFIEHKYLAPVDYYAPADIDISKLKTKRTGEFDDASVEEALKPKIYGDAVKSYKKLASGKQAIAYTYNVASAKRLAQEFLVNGIRAESVDGTTPAEERDRIVAAYREGKIDVLTNAELFTEGIDLPNVDVVIMLRPTQSLSLYLQFAMRSMNPRPGKTAVIIDHVANVNRFGLPTDNRQWHLAGREDVETGTHRDPIKPVTVCPACFATFYRTGSTCPFCGATLSQENQLEVVEDAHLIKLETKRRLAVVHELMDNNVSMNVANKRPDQLKSMKELQAYAKLAGYKPGWAYIQGKNRGFI